LVQNADCYFVLGPLNVSNFDNQFLLANTRTQIEIMKYFKKFLSIFLIVNKMLGVGENAQNHSSSFKSVEDCLVGKNSSNK